MGSRDGSGRVNKMIVFLTCRKNGPVNNYVSFANFKDFFFCCILYGQYGNENIVTVTICVNNGISLLSLGSQKVEYCNKTRKITQKQSRFVFTTGVFSATGRFGGDLNSKELNTSNWECNRNC